MTDGVDGKQAVALFCPDLTETSTIKRAQAFLDQGYEIVVFAFRRGRYNGDFVPPWPCVPLGATGDRRYLQRLLALLHALPILFRERRRLREVTAFYARNFDQLVLVFIARWLLRSAAPVVYEVLDILPVMNGRHPVSVILRALERVCLLRIAALVLSSPGFHRNYFTAVQRYAGRWFLLENKLHSSILETTAGAMAGHERRKRSAGQPWVIGCYGLIRGNATLDLIVRLAERLGDRVQFRFRGVLTTVEDTSFSAALRRCPNIVYGGPYSNPRDLADIYSGVDFAWALDLEHTNHNSRWLLPCRFYEAGYFGVPCLAVREFEIGTMIDRLEVGWTFSEPLEESMVRFFETLTEEEYQSCRNRLLSQPRSLFISDGDLAELCAHLRPAIQEPIVQEVWSNPAAVPPAPATYQKATGEAG